MPPPPFFTWPETMDSDGFRASRFGPTWPDAPAAESVWQLEQFAVKIALPSADACCVVVVVAGVVAGVVAVALASVVESVWVAWPAASLTWAGVGPVSLLLPHAASTRPVATTAETARRERIGAVVIGSSGSTVDGAVLRRQTLSGSVPAETPQRRCRRPLGGLPARSPPAAADGRGGRARTRRGRRAAPTFQSISRRSLRLSPASSPGGRCAPATRRARRAT